jgi:hypothetical protein
MKQLRQLTVKLVLGFLFTFGSMAGAQVQAAELSESDFKTFVLVNVELQNLSDQYGPALDGSGDDAAKREGLQKEVQEKTLQVLAKNNLTPDAYQRLYKTVNGDPELRAKALQAIQQERQKR